MSEQPPHASAPSPIPTTELRWRCDPALLDFATTNDVAPIQEIVGQDAAVESLRFGLAIDAPGQNIFVRGIAGTGRLSAVQHLLHNLGTPQRKQPDRCYVHDFEDKSRPRLIRLPRGRGAA